jgi:hypothetical protein
MHHSFRKIDFAYAEVLPNTLWNDEYLIGPRILDFAAGCIAAYIDVSSTRIEGANNVSGFARNRLGGWKFTLC